MAFDLPPLQQDLSFLRLSMVLAELCHQVYAAARAVVEDVAHVELPTAGHFGEPVTVAAKLLHFRYSLAGQQVKCLWHVPASLYRDICSKLACNCQAQQTAVEVLLWHAVGVQLGLCFRGAALLLRPSGICAFSTIQSCSPFML